MPLSPGVFNLTRQTLPIDELGSLRYTYTTSVMPGGRRAAWKIPNAMRIINIKTPTIIVNHGLCNSTLPRHCLCLAHFMMIMSRSCMTSAAARAATVPISQSRCCRAGRFMHPMPLELLSNDKFQPVIPAACPQEVWGGPKTGNERR